MSRLYSKGYPQRVYFKNEKMKKWKNEIRCAEMKKMKEWGNEMRFAGMKKWQNERMKMSTNSGFDFCNSL